MWSYCSGQKTRISFLEAQIKLLLHKKFGPASEKIPFEQLQLLGMELSLTQAEVDNEAADAQRKADPATPKEPGPNQGHPGRNEFPAHLERRERIVPCAPDQCLCGQCGQTKVVIGYETSEELDLVPARYFVQVTKREKRAWSHCAKAGVTTAAPVPKIIPKSTLSDAFIIEVLLAKYCMHTPVYRQAAMLWRDAGVVLSQQTMTDSILHVGSLLNAVSRALRQDLLKGWLHPGR